MTKRIVMLWTVIQAETGETLLADADNDAFDRWHDEHANYRKVIGINEVGSEHRERYARRASREVFVMQENKQIDEDMTNDDENSAALIAGALIADHAIRRASGTEARDIAALRHRFACVNHADIDAIVQNRNIKVTTKF
ncbi:hypothetical protein [Paraburkholderia youngii]|uniref:hypothetical protein n=1 Tax=Paraburkholderia youngii TaxID=2782701 RepID=UPI003D1DF9A9